MISNDFSVDEIEGLVPSNLRKSRASSQNSLQRSVSPTVIGKHYFLNFNIFRAIHILKIENRKLTKIGKKTKIKNTFFGSEQKEYLNNFQIFKFFNF